jgi:phosphoketolase
VIDEMEMEIETAGRGPLSPELLTKMDAYWRAANYLSVRQIYLNDNPLLERPPTLDKAIAHCTAGPGIWTWASKEDAAEQWYSEAIQRLRLYVAENGDDLPEIKNWRWPRG